MPSVLLLTTGDRLLLTTGDALLLALADGPPEPTPGPVDAHALACVVTPFCPEDEEP